MSELAGGDAQQARKTFHRVLQSDPHYAKAHYQMGEIALFNRNFKYSTEELELAMGDSDRLSPHEQALTRLSIALAARNPSESRRLGDEVDQQWPDDPDVARMRATFPGMFNEVRRERGRRRLRP
jgi:thioredoxin-like negative regulator of GroEL